MKKLLEVGFLLFLMVTYKQHTGVFYTKKVSMWKNLRLCLRLFGFFRSFISQRVACGDVQCQKAHGTQFLFYYKYKFIKTDVSLSFQRQGSSHILVLLKAQRLSLGDFYFVLFFCVGIYIIE